MSENANKKHMKTQSRSEQKRDQKAFGNASKKLSETRARSFQNCEKDAFVTARKLLLKEARSEKEACENARKQLSKTEERCEKQSKLIACKNVGVASNVASKDARRWRVESITDCSVSSQGRQRFQGKLGQICP